METRASVWAFDFRSGGGSRRISKQVRKTETTMGSGKRPKIGFITHANARDRGAQSGTAYYTPLLLNEHCGEVFHIDNLIPAFIRPEYILRHWFARKAYLLFIEFMKSRFWRILGKRYDLRMSPNASRFCALRIESVLNKIDCDLLWVEKSCVSLAYLETAIPVIYESDATFHAMIDYYPWFTGLSESAVRNGEALERAALEKAAAVILTADWAKESAIHDYGIAESKITILPSPANWDRIPERASVLRKKKRDACNLLFLGVDWERKGGDTAVAVVEELNHRGTRAILSVCGCTPPKRYSGNRHMKLYGYLDKNNDHDRQVWERLFTESHFFILPTRAECMGISFSEAAAFGLPVIATDTGGVSTVVKDDRNGFLFQPEDSPAAIAGRVGALWKDENRYEAMRKECRLFFEEKLSPEAWARSVNAIIARLAD